MLRVCVIRKLLILAAIILPLAACTSAKVEPLSESPQQASVPNAPVLYQEVAIGDLTATREIWNHYLPYLREGIAKELEESGKFQRVHVSLPDPAGERLLVLSGQLTTMDEGSKALRFLIGFGAGSTTAAGTFELADGGGSLTRFNIETDYAGGAGIGGLDMISTNELVQKLGVDAAEATVRWSQGKGLKPPTKN